MSHLPHRFSRSTLLAACSVLKSLTHSELDRFLLEMGVDEIDAGQDKGGLLARTNELGKFIVNNASMKTAEGSSVQLSVIEKALLVDRNYPHGILKGVGDDERRAFQQGLASDGYAPKHGQLEPSSEIQKPSPAPKKDPSLDVFSQIFGQINRPTRRQAPVKSKKIFLVHGHDGAARNSVELFLRELDLIPIVLHKQPNKGRTLITKFQEESEGAEFAVVLITPDDIGGVVGSSEADLNPRGRQNVIFELGFFYGKLGPENVCPLVVAGVEEPSDLKGVVYVPFDDTAKWKNDLAREMVAAGVPFDHKRVFGG